MFKVPAQSSLSNIAISCLVFPLVPHELGDLRDDIGLLRMLSE